VRRFYSGVTDRDLAQTMIIHGWCAYPVGSGTTKWAHGGRAGEVARQGAVSLPDLAGRGRRRIK
jgi:hypothetical protein